MKKVLFIFTSNSQRSQMTEALVNYGRAGRMEASSAGTEPSSFHPMALQARAELGMDIAA